MFYDLEKFYDLLTNTVDDSNKCGRAQECRT